MKAVLGIAALVFLTGLIRTIVSMVRLAKSNLDQVNPDVYGFESLKNSKAFWWTLIPFIILTIVFFAM